MGLPTTGQVTLSYHGRCTAAPCYPPHITHPPQRGLLCSCTVQVAEVCVAALVEPAAANKVVEVIAESGAPARTMLELFTAV